MPRTAITFKLSAASHLQDLLNEFALHEGVSARATGSDANPLLTVETSAKQSSVWDIRATVGLFDDQAVEVSTVGDEQPA